MRRFRCALTPFLALLLVSLALPSGAQTATASIAGSVVDTTGAAVHGASITVRNTDLDATRSVRSDRTGSFRVSGLVSGSYTIEAQAGKLALRRPVRVTLYPNLNSG